MESTEAEELYAREEEGDLEYPIVYNITSSPNDFNIRTLYDFLDSGVVKIPGFQRNFVWDIKRSSRLIESILMGIPIPQLFFYEKGKNEFLVIDGQQRLMTLYYFIKGRFPKADKRPEIRRIIDETGNVSEDLISDDSYFSDFSLKLKSGYTGSENRLEGITYESMPEKSELNLKTIRCIFIKQLDPRDDSSIYEIFFRLNTGGINLTPQEIRSSLYYSSFYEMLTRMNLDPRWRRLTTPEPDVRMRDIEILLRGFAMLSEAETYKPPMIKFLNDYSKRSKSFERTAVDYSRALLDKFLETCSILPEGAFKLSTGRISASIYDSVFVVLCKNAFEHNTLDVLTTDSERLNVLRNDEEFMSATESQTTSKFNVGLRIKRAREILLVD
jgi:hypothetical protein